VATGESLLDRHEFLRSGFFNEFLKPYDIDRFMNVVLRAPPASGRVPDALFSFYRGINRCAFSRDDVALLQRIAPHLVLATKNSIFIQSMIAARDALGQAIDSMTVATFSMDRDGRICIANDAAEDEFRRAEFLRVINGQICAAESVRDARALNLGLRRGLEGIGSSLVVKSTTGTEAFLAVAPFDHLSGPSASSACVPVCTVWLSRLRIPTEGLAAFAQHFQLSDAELALLRSFVACEDLNRAAQMLSRSVHTVRGQMKSIFHKTCRRSQGQLLAAIAGFSAIRLNGDNLKN
jgi:DNA-binding CsgD family transcriptional regulator